MITVEKSDPHSTESRHLLEKLSAELAFITGDNGQSNFTIDAMNAEGSLWVLARDSKGNAIGCGAIRPVTENVAELKRMFSDRSHSGTGAALITFLETAAKSMGYHALWLETRRVNLRAVNFYEKHGYARISNYGPYTDREEAVCFAKSLSA